MLAGLDRKNAETIFGAIGDEIEKIGVHLLDARVFHGRRFGRRRSHGQREGKD
jgi:hypothetical protein